MFLKKRFVIWEPDLESKIHTCDVLWRSVTWDRDFLGEIEICKIDICFVRQKFVIWDRDFICEIAFGMVDRKV